MQISNNSELVPPLPIDQNDVTEFFRGLCAYAFFQSQKACWTPYVLKYKLTKSHGQGTWPCCLIIYGAGL